MAELVPRNLALILVDGDANDPYGVTHAPGCLIGEVADNWLLANWSKAAVAMMGSAVALQMAGTLTLT